MSCSLETIPLHLTVHIKARHNGGQSFFNVKSVRGRQDGYVDAKYPSELTQRLIEFPARVVTMTETMPHNWAIFGTHGVEVFPTRGA
jgi:hypothetical protein